MRRDPQRARAATILLVDDRPTNRQFLSTLLGYGGHRLLEAADGAEALRLVKAEHPDLVISDILMPTMDGFEFAKSVRADPEIAATKIVFYTAAYRATEAALLAKACGVSVVIAKPAEPQRVIDVVNEQLGIAPLKLVPQAMAKPEEAARAEPPGSTLSHLGVQITDYVNDLRGVKAQLDGLVERGLKLEKEREHLRGISTKFAQNVAQLHTTSGRLYALVELGMDLAQERDAQRLLQVFTGAARQLLGARSGVTVALQPNEDRVQHVATEGLEPGAARAMQSIARGDGVLEEILATRKVVRLAAPAGKTSVAGLPAGHPPAQSLLGAAIASASRCYGVAFFTDKRGGAAEFDEEDEKMLRALAAQLAVTCEKLELYDTTQRHAAALQIEIDQRKGAETDIRKLNRVYAVLSGINTLIVRARDRDELFREACSIAVRKGQFRMAWVGRVDRAVGLVKPVASDGEVRGFFDASPLAAEDSKRRAKGKGMAWQAIQEKRPVISNDVQNDPQTAMKPECKERGINSLVMLPLVLGGEGVGVLALYAAETGFFDDEEMKLLNELAGDISFALDHLQKAEKLDYLAYYDELTGLPNRTQFEQGLAQRIDAARLGGHKLAVLVFNIDRFRTVNDSLGRGAGDELLRQIADRMKRAATDPRLIARIGADSFAIVRPLVTSEESVARHNDEKFAECFGTPFRVGDTEVRIATKVGIAMYPADGAEAETLYRNAEAALKKAKATGEHRLFYAQDMSVRVAGQLALETKLRQALERDEFVLHYQPKVDLETRSIVGAEALIRWQSPELGLVPPMKFIPLLEETGLIRQVGSWALHRAALDHRSLVEQGLKAPRIAVNVSPIQLRQQDFVAVVEAAILGGIAPTGIDLEITESLVMQEIEANIAKLKSVRALGISIAIDDFGTGYSSLAYLAKLPVQTIKIDRSFIITMLDDPDTATLVQTIISLARSLRMTVVAEGVDAEAQAKFLQLIRCDQMQGYLFSKPVPLAALATLLSGATRKVAA